MTAPTDLLRRHKAVMAVIIDRELIRASMRAPIVFGIILKYIDDDTGEAFPSVEKIAKEAGVMKNSVFAALKALETRGHLVIVPGKGRRVNHYTLPAEPPRSGPPGDTTTPAPVPGSGATGDTTTTRSGATGDTTTDPRSGATGDTTNRSGATDEVVAVQRTSRSGATGDTRSHLLSHSLSQEQSQSHARERARELAAAMERAGCKSVDPNRRDLQAASAEGVTDEMLYAAVKDGLETGGVKKLASWAIGTARGRRRDMVEAKAVQQGMQPTKQREGRAVSATDVAQALLDRAKASIP